MLRNLRLLLDNSGVTVKELSEKTGISIRSIQSYLAFETSPTLENVIKIADFFGVPIDFLCGRFVE